MTATATAARATRAVRPARREAMRASAHGLGQAMAASALADQVEGAAAQRAGAPIG
mgnify:CR=1 FL=1